MIGCNKEKRERLDIGDFIWDLVKVKNSRTVGSCVMAWDSLKIEARNEEWLLSAIQASTNQEYLLFKFSIQ
jgi:hypothetical protein